MTSDFNIFHENVFNDLYLKSSETISPFDRDQYSLTQLRVCCGSLAPYEAFYYFCLRLFKHNYLYLTLIN